MCYPYERRIVSRQLPTLLPQTCRGHSVVSLKLFGVAGTRVKQGECGLSPKSEKKTSGWHKQE